MSSGPLGLPWLLWAGVAWVVATVFAFVVPRSAGATGLQYVILRWFHALVWTLLGLSALARELVPARGQLADLIAQLALAVYLAYLVTFVRARA
ncbi:MAG TPA: hypothetical protein VGV90_04990 [Solirubrobacteraceae bacterium]|nr:hypothetical protein [Solirubrobacteraceae bacterium]